MDYYNGVIFQGFLPKIPFPVLSGGRYDNLPRKMGKEVGAIGFALYMGRLEQFFGQERQYDADVLLTYGPDADLVKLAAFAERLRQEAGRSAVSGRGAALSGALPEESPVHRRDRPGGGAGMINVALPKGRLGETAYETLAAAGYDCPAIWRKPQADL